MRKVVVVIALIGVLAFPVAAADWQPLFNGKDLSGWHEVLGGKWSVSGSDIVGETGDGRYGWLVTNREHRNFVLELEFKTEAPGNSGVQFRSHVVMEGPGRASRGRSRRGSGTAIASLLSRRASPRS